MLEKIQNWLTLHPFIEVMVGMVACVLKVAIMGGIAGSLLWLCAVIWFPLMLIVFGIILFLMLAFLIYIDVYDKYPWE